MKAREKERGLPHWHDFRDSLKKAGFGGKEIVFLSEEKKGTLARFPFPLRKTGRSLRRSHGMQLANLTLQ